MNKWINPTHKLPKDSKRVLLKIHDGAGFAILVGYLNGDQFEIDYEWLIGRHRYYRLMNDAVIAWAELPE